jgi:gamma-glutamyltranspeptidase
MWQIVGDMPESRFLCEKLLAPDSITAIRAQAFEAGPATDKVAQLEVDASYESEMAATTHFVIVDREGNIVWTQSLAPTSARCCATRNRCRDERFDEQLRIQ